MDKKEIILIIDDEEVMRDGCKQILSKEGYLAETAEDGAIGLEKVKEMKPDAVLIDLKMPGISGMEVLEKLPDIDPLIIPIVITGYATVESAVEAMKKGAFDFLPKPFTPDELRIIIKRGLEKRQLIRETERLREEKKKIEENFITMVTHQLRSPLTTVQQYFEVILGGITGEVAPKQKEMMGRARNKIKGLLELIDDWLEMARISKDQMVNRFKPVDLIPILSGIIEFMKPAAQEKQISLHMEPRTDLPRIQGDDETLEQLFANIISNAITYNRPGGKVQIKVREEDDSLVVEISDTGIGIAEKDISFLFDQFYRIKREETQHIKGTGLGLHIAKKIVDAHDGIIKVSSVLNAGTTFSIFLPKAGI